MQQRIPSFSAEAAHRTEKKFSTSYARNRDPISIIYKERQALDIKHQPKTWGMDLHVKFSKGERQMAKKHFYFIVKYP